MRCAASKRPVRVLVEHCLHGAMVGGVVGEFVLPLTPVTQSPARARMRAAWGWSCLATRPRSLTRGRCTSERA
jgi:hypothetical protein